MPCHPTSQVTLLGMSRPLRSLSPEGVGPGGSCCVAENHESVSRFFIIMQINVLYALRARAVVPIIASGWLAGRRPALIIIIITDRPSQHSPFVACALYSDKRCCLRWRRSSRRPRCQQWLHPLPAAAVRPAPACRRAKNKVIATAIGSRRHRHQSASKHDCS